MANLFEINQAILECVDLETGELLDFERLEHLQMEKNQKIENIICWYKNLLSDAEAIKAEKDAFAEREAKCRKKAEQLKQYLTFALQGEQFSTTKGTVSFRRSEKVEVTDADKIPEEFLTEKVTKEPNKLAIKAMLKSGCEISGCRLIEALNPQIK